MRFRKDKRKSTLTHNERKIKLKWSNYGQLDEITFNDETKFCIGQDDDTKAFV